MVISQTLINFLLSAICGKSPTGKIYIPPKNARCWHHDDNEMWQLAVELKLLKNDEKYRYSWRFCHKLTNLGRNVIIQEIERIDKNTL